MFVFLAGKTHLTGAAAKGKRRAGGEVLGKAPWLLAPEPPSPRAERRTPRVTRQHVLRGLTTAKKELMLKSWL